MDSSICVTPTPKDRNMVSKSKVGCINWGWRYTVANGVSAPVLALPWRKDYEHSVCYVLLCSHIICIPALVLRGLGTKTHSPRSRHSFPGCKTAVLPGVVVRLLMNRTKSLWSYWQFGLPNTGKILLRFCGMSIVEYTESIFKPYKIYSLGLWCWIYTVIVNKKIDHLPGS
jgi:hypothetical protein